MWPDLINSVVFQWPLGLGRTVLLIAAAGTATVWWYGRSGHGGDQAVRATVRFGLMTLRLAGLGVLAWVLAGPAIRQEGHLSDQPVPVMLLLDTSASMATRDTSAHTGDAVTPIPVTNTGDQMTSRWQAVTQSWLAPPFLDRLNELPLDIRWLGFDRGVYGIIPGQAVALDQPDGPATDLTSALSAGLPAPATAGPEATPEAPRPANNNPAAIVLISDGHDTGQADALRSVIDRLKQHNRPVTTVAVGTTQAPPDLALQAWAETDRLLKGQATWIHAVVSQRGLGGQRVRVDLLRDGQRVESQQAKLDPLNPIGTHLRFRIAPPPPRAGSVAHHAYEVVVTPVPPSDPEDRFGQSQEEAVTANNRRWVFVAVTNQRINVALFEAQPHWDTKYLAQALQADDQVNLTAFYQLAADRSLQVRSGEASDADGPGTPPPSGLLTPSQLNAFDVVILGKGVDAFFGGQRAQMLVDYATQRNGSIVLARGRAFDPTTESGRTAQSIFSQIEPVVWADTPTGQSRFMLTPAGRASPLLRFDDPGAIQSLLTTLTAGASAPTPTPRAKEAAVVLMRQAPLPGRPDRDRESGASEARVGLVYQRVSGACVLAVLQDGWWRWAALPRRMSQYDGLYRLFWARAIRWLAAGGRFPPGQPITLDVSPLSVSPGQPITVTLTTWDGRPLAAPPRLTLVAPDGQHTPLQPARTDGLPARYLATVEPNQPGLYTLTRQTDTNPTATADPSAPLLRRFVVNDRSIERLDPSARPQLLQWISQETGGLPLGVDEPHRLLAYLQGLGAAKQADIKLRDGFNQPTVLVLIMGLFGIEWIVRRRIGWL